MRYIYNKQCVLQRYKNKKNRKIGKTKEDRIDIIATVPRDIQ
jgi:hypothetical protein